MRIFLTGASGTGKTSVGKLLAERLNLDHLPSVSRGSPHKQGSLEHQLYTEKGIVQTANDAGVHDRTLLDVLGYDYAFGHSIRISMLNNLAAWGYTNPTVIYFPILFDAEDDGVRPIDKELNAQVDQVIRTGLDIWVPAGYHTVKLESVSDRVDSVIQYLRGQHG